MIPDHLLQEVERFSISYDAEDEELAVHQMDALALGEAIRQVALMIKQADKILNDGQETVDLRVTVPAEEGSFLVEFALFTIANSNAILPALGFSALGGGALAVAHRLGDKRVVNVHSDDGENATITYQDDNGTLMTITCPKDEAELATNSTIRQAYSEIISQPLADKQSAKFKVIVDGVDVVEIEGEMTQEFSPMPRESLTHESVDRYDAVVSLTRVNFTSETGWRMRYLDEERAVRMEDGAFMAAVLSNQRSFVRGDLFNVRLRVTTTERPHAKTRIVYAIEQVYRHLADEDRRLT